MKREDFQELTFFFETRWYTDEAWGKTIVKNEKIPTTSGHVKKIWDDENNKYRKRPKQIYIELEKNVNGGEFAVVTSVMMGEKEHWPTVGGWQYAFNERPVQNSDRSETYQYRVTESERYEDDFFYCYIPAYTSIL